MRHTDGMRWNRALKVIMRHALPNWGSAVPCFASELFDRLAFNAENELGSSVRWPGYRKVNDVSFLGIPATDRCPDVRILPIT